MIDINKLENLADEIINNASKDDLQNWLESYRIRKSSFVNFKTVETSFKMGFSHLKFSKKNVETYSAIVGYSFAA